MAALVGINQIKPHVGNVSESTILRWKREYDSFPIRKLRGQWVGEESEITEWFRNFIKGDIDFDDNKKQTQKKPVKRQSRSNRRK